MKRRITPVVSIIIVLMSSVTVWALDGKGGKSSDKNATGEIAQLISRWQIGFLEGLDWGMEGKDVEKILSKKRLRLKVVSNHTYEGVVHHGVEVLGQPLYGRIRVDGIRMSFENKKLTSVSFGPADKSESAADKLYTYTTKLFGLNITTTSEPSHEVKKKHEVSQFML